MPGQFTVTLTAQQFAAANWLLVKRHWVRRWAPWITAGIGLLFGLVLVLSAYHFHPETTPRKALSIFAKGVMFALLFVGLQLFVLLRIIGGAARPAFGESAAHEIAYSMSDDGLAMTIEGRTTQFAWSQFRRVIEDANWLLLCRSEATFCAFPKSQLDEGTCLALKRALETHRAKPQP